MSQPSKLYRVNTPILQNNLVIISLQKVVVYLDLSICPAFKKYNILSSVSWL